MENLLSRAVAIYVSVIRLAPWAGRAAGQSLGFGVVASLARERTPVRGKPSKPAGTRFIQRFAATDIGTSSVAEQDKSTGQIIWACSMSIQSHFRIRVISRVISHCNAGTEQLQLNLPARRANPRHRLHRARKAMRESRSKGR